MTTYLITTHHNKDTRHEYIKDHLYSFDVVPIMASDWRMFKHTNLNEAQYKQQSLTLAYYTSCQTAVFCDLEEFMILEDDVHIYNKFLFDSALESLPHDFDLVYLAYTKHNAEGAITKPYNEYYATVIANYWETPATLWSIDFAKKFIQYIESKLEKGLWLGHIDHELLKILTEQRPKYYCLTEPLVIGLSSEPEKAPQTIDLSNSISAK